MPQQQPLGASQETLTQAHVVFFGAPNSCEVRVHALDDVLDLLWRQLGSRRRTVLGGPLLAGENMLSHLLVPLTAQDCHTCGTGCPATMVVGWLGEWVVVGGRGRAG